MTTDRVQTGRGGFQQTPARSPSRRKNETRPRMRTAPRGAIRPPDEDSLDPSQKPIQQLKPVEVLDADLEWIDLDTLFDADEPA